MEAVGSGGASLYCCRVPGIFVSGVLCRRQKAPKKGACRVAIVTPGDSKLPCNGGGPGIRTPGGSLLNGFQDRRFRPLSQPTGNLIVLCSPAVAGEEGGIIQSCCLGTSACLRLAPKQGVLLQDGLDSAVFASLSNATSTLLSAALSAPFSSFAEAFDGLGRGPRGSLLARGTMRPLGCTEGAT